MSGNSGIAQLTCCSGQSAAPASPAAARPPPSPARYISTIRAAPRQGLGALLFAGAALGEGGGAPEEVVGGGGELGLCARGGGAGHAWTLAELRDGALQTRGWPFGCGEVPAALLCVGGRGGGRELLVDRRERRGEVALAPTGAFGLRVGEEGTQVLEGAADAAGRGRLPSDVAAGPGARVAGVVGAGVAVVARRRRAQRRHGQGGGGRRDRRGGG